jgi:Raf kinase inhibitor-like YbhB/YbcL family protein
MIAFAAEVGCTQLATEQQVAPSLTVASSSFPTGVIPDTYSCHGQNVSPELSWSSPPRRTRSFALIVTDEDSSPANFVHWVLYDLPPEARDLREGMPKDQELADGSRQGRNDFRGIGYGGPCPPGDAPHRYVFTLYALDSRLNVASGATKDQILPAMKGHMVAKGELVGRYPR